MKWNIFAEKTQFLLEIHPIYFESVYNIVIETNVGVQT